MIYQTLKVIVAQAAGVKPGEVKLEHPEVEEHGDYSTNIALVMKGGRKLAEEIAGRIEKGDLIEKVEVAGAGFVNIYLKKGILIDEVYRVIEQAEKFGSSDWGKGQTWLIEHTSPNPNKAMHLGHLRNNVTAMAVANLWEYSGMRVIRDAIDNNRGIAIAKLMYGYLVFAKKEKAEPTLEYWFKHQSDWYSPLEKGVRPDRFVDELYVKGSLLYDGKDTSETVQPVVKQMVIDWEAEKPEIWALWKKVLEFSYKGQEMTLARLGSRWDYVWHEHEIYKQGKEIVNKGIEKGIFTRLENGGVLTNLKQFNLPDTIVIKSDNTALYITQDLALTKLKKERFNPDKMFWTIGPEQGLALQQMYAVCEQLGFGKREDYTHLSYGYMSIKGQGKMSSRTGNVVFIDDLLDMAKSKILEVIKDRNFDEKEKDKIAEAVGVGAVKYSILKINRTQDTCFDIQESVSLEGNSGPYLQYTYARTQSVLAKSNITPLDPPLNLRGGNPKGEGDISYDLNPEELSILRWIYRFSEVVEEAAIRYAPNLVCNFLYELAQRFNTFYNKHSILNLGNITPLDPPLNLRGGNPKGEGDIFSGSRQMRLLITKAVGQVLKNGLNLLGIEVLERM